MRITQLKLPIVSFLHMLYGQTHAHILYLIGCEQGGLCFLNTISTSDIFPQGSDIFDIFMAKSKWLFMALKCF